MTFYPHRIDVLWRDGEPYCDLCGRGLHDKKRGACGNGGAGWRHNPRRRSGPMVATMVANPAESAPATHE
jgi:hypothetical protein